MLSTKGEVSMCRKPPFCEPASAISGQPPNTGNIVMGGTSPNVINLTPRHAQQPATGPHDLM